EAPAAKRQIVSPSDLTETEPPQSTRLLSEKNSQVAKEMLKRGDGPLAGAPGDPGQSSPSPPAARQQPQSREAPAEVEKQKEATVSAPVAKKPVRSDTSTREAQTDAPLDLKPRLDYFKDIQ